jgi:hypothetical protein
MYNLETLCPYMFALEMRKKEDKDGDKVERRRKRKKRAGGYFAHGKETVRIRKKLGL